MSNSIEINIPAKGQEQNEYIVSFFNSKEKGSVQNIPDVIDSEVRNKVITPAIAKIFSLLEFLGVMAVYVSPDDQKEYIVYSKAEYRTLLEKQLGKQYVTAMIHEAYKLLTFFNIKSFRRNVESKKWEKEHKIVEERLTKFLKDSIGK